MEIIDRRSVLLPLRSFYFFNFAALGALFPFLPLLLSSRGMSPDQIRWIMVLTPLSNLLIPPLWGSLADALRARLTLLRIACLGSALTVLLLLVLTGFWGHIAAIGALSLFRAPLTPLGDATTYDALGGRRVNFSVVRVWGSLGFAIFVLTPGVAEGSLQAQIVVVVTALIFVSAGLSTLSLKAPSFQRQRQVLRQTWRILARPAVSTALLSSAVYYTAHAMYDAWFSLHLRELGHSDVFIGAAWSVGVVAEIVIMLLAPRFIHRVGSGVLLTVCASVAVLRWFLLSVVTSAAPVLLAQTLHAVTFGVWYLSLVKFSQERAPDHLRTSLQSFTAAYMGLGMVAGYLIGGELMERFQGQVLFGVATWIAVGAASLYLVSLIIQRAEARRAETSPIDVNDDVAT